MLLGAKDTVFIFERYAMPILYYAAFFYLFTTTPAYAYLDPGTGSLILQALIAGIAAGLTAIKIFWTKISMTWNKILGKTPKENKEDDTHGDA